MNQKSFRTLKHSLILQWYVSQKKAIQTDELQFNHKPIKSYQEREKKKRGSAEMA